MISIVLTTARLQLNPCRLEDIVQVHQLWTNEQIRNYLFDNRLISREEAQSFITESLSNFEKYKYGIWLVFWRETNNLAGFAGFGAFRRSAP